MTLTWLGVAILIFLAVSCYIGYKRGFVKEVVSTFFLLLTMGIVWLINPYVNDFIKENTPVYTKIQENCREFIGMETEESETMDKTAQENLIENLPLPEFLKEDVQENNTLSIYNYLSVNTFTDYVAKYLACTVVNGISFMVSFFLATTLVRIATYALDILSKLPVINGANKTAGAVLGIIKGILFVWIAFLILTVLSLIHI